MKRFYFGAGLVLLLSFLPTFLLAAGANSPTYLVDRYSNNGGPGSPIDTMLRLINVGSAGNPQTSPVGDVCANIYVFDSNQEMISCCSCRLTPNELITSSVANDLTNNPLVSVIPVNGVIKIMPTAATAATCDPTATAPSDSTLLEAATTHLEVTGGSSYMTESEMAAVPLSSGEAGFLVSACTFVQYLGGGYGRGTCGCNGKIYGIVGTISGPGGSNATVTLGGDSSATANADSNGNYAFPGLKAGSYTVTPSNSGFAFTPASQPVTVATVVTGVNFSTVTYSISGTISGAGGAGASVSLTGSSAATVTADAAGNYTFSGLQNGSYLVTPGKAGFIFTPASQPASVNSSNVTAVNFSSTATYGISGTIAGAGGAGATVTLTGASTATAIADASGNYAFSGLLNGSYTVTPSKAGFTFTPASMAATVNNSSVTVNFGTVTYSILGTIGGPGGGAATVNLSGSSSATVTADSSGNYTFTGLQNGSYTVTPSKTGFTYTPASQSATINSASVSALNFNTVTYTVSGTISGAGGGTATVTLSGASTATTTADGSGNFTFSGLTNGAYTITPSKSGFSFSPASQPVTLKSATVSGVSFGTVTYTISGTINGAGGSGATVNLTGSATSTVSADGSGNYAFSGLTNGAYTVTPSKSGFNFSPASQPVTLNSASVSALNFATVTYTISGTISGAGGPGASVSLSGSSSAAVTADGSGNFTFTGLQNGSYTITPSKANFTFTPASQPATISNASVTALNFATVTYTISGVISGTGGPGATVSLAGAATSSVTADGSGNYSFSGLTNGAYTVTAGKSGYTFSPASQPVTLSGASVSGVNFGTITYTIAGTIAGLGGPGATVSLSGSATATVTANASGNYAFSGLTNGSYTVTPSQSGFSFSPGSQAVTVNNAGVSAVNFTTVTYTISGSVSGAGGAGATVTLGGAAAGTVTADANGNYAFTGLPSGAYVVTPSQSGFSFTPPSQSVTVSTVNLAAVNFGTVTYTLSGTLTGPGSNGANVTVTGPTTATVASNSSGNFTLTGLNNGFYNVTSSYAGVTFNPDWQSVTINGANVTGTSFSSFQNCPCSIWNSSVVPGTIDASDSNAIEVGVRFGSDVVGYITGILFYKGSTNTGTHIGNLWSNSGKLLATATFSNESASGWQQVNFSHPVQIAANTTYVASYHTAVGNYSYDQNYFTSAYNSPPLHARQDGSNGANGVYTYSSSSAFPTTSYLSTNYYVDVVFATAQTISGTIGGPGGAGATVTLSGASNATTTADASGNYSFTNVISGSYTVTPSQSGVTFAPASRTLTATGADIPAVNFTSNPGLAMDQVVSTDRNTTSTILTSPTLTTANSNELLLALISTDASSAGITVNSVTSSDGVLTWSLVKRTNTQLGTAEIWRAFSPSPLTTAVTATLSQSVAASITVVTFTGVDTTTTNGAGTIGATAGNNADPGVPAASLTTTRNNSWVIGVGNDWDSATSRTTGANQTMIHQFLAAHGDTFWVQSQTNTTPLAGTVVTINDSAPTGDRYNLSLCEVLPSQ